MDTYLHGAPAEIATAFLGYEREGVSHLMIKATPNEETEKERDDGYIFQFELLQY